MRHDDETASLRALSPEGLEALTGLGRRQRSPKGAPLFVEGEQSDRVLCILDRRVKVSLVTAPPTQEELAGWTGSSREAVSQALGSLRSLGCIETGRRRVTILGVPGLRKRAV